MATERPDYVVIKPFRGGFGVDWLELWYYRELLGFLIWRDIKVRYKQTVLGVAWAILQPLLTTLAFALVFDDLVDVPSSGIPYLAFAYVGLVPWWFFSNGVHLAALSLVNNQRLVNKTYLPRLLIPLSSILSGIVNFAVSASIILLLMIGFGLVPGWALILLPFFVVQLLAATIGVGILLAATHALYRDVGHVIPFLMQFWLFVSPVAYPASLIQSDALRWLYALNPMVGVVEGMRWSLLDATPPAWQTLVISGCSAVAILLIGIGLFHRMEKIFADRI